MSGKPAHYVNKTYEECLAEWTKPFLDDKNKISQVMDSHIEAQYSLLEAMKVACIVIHCVYMEDRDLGQTWMRWGDHWNNFRIPMTQLFKGI